LEGESPKGGFFLGFLWWGGGVGGTKVWDENRGGGGGKSQFSKKSISFKGKNSAA